jgi:hypothetical protein
MIDTLEARSLASSDFTTGSTTMSIGDRIRFSENIGYSSEQCTKGYYTKGDLFTIQ